MVTIDLDLHATTPVAPFVAERMEPYWRRQSWNAHSEHGGGAYAERAVELAREAVAQLIGAAPREICFTSGATEANNIALLGLASAARISRSERSRVLVSAIEHKSVLAAADALSAYGLRSETLRVDSAGLLDLDALEAKIGSDVLLVSVMAANNEIGTIQPLERIAEICARHGVLFHVDAAQAVGKIGFDAGALGCDLASVSAHKFYGPKGIGALYVNAGSALKPQPITFGGGQELGLRPGTLPVPLVVGFGAAAELAATRLEAGGRLRKLAAIFLDALAAQEVSAELNGDAEHRLPGSLNIRVCGVNSSEVIGRLGMALLLSSGSACQSGELQESYVLRALGLDDVDAAASFRLCFGYDHSEVDAVEAARLLAQAIETCQKPTGRPVQREILTSGALHIG